MMKSAWSTPNVANLSEPKIAVLLCTYNGALYLRDQINSLAQQTHSNFVLWVSDDGSNDQTIEMLEHAQQTWGPDRLVILNGPRQGFARNFLHLACHTDIAADYYAFCDQDDIWSPQKLHRAIKHLSQMKQDQACLYAGATRLIDDRGTDVGKSPHQKGKLDFSNALVQNFASGNTMVFNQSLKHYLKQAGAELNIVSHDWWLYIVTTAVGGKVVFDHEAQVYYRQHKDNLIGANAKIFERLKRIKAMSSGRLLNWIQINCQCLQRIQTSMTPANQQLWHTVKEMRYLPRLRRLPSILNIKLQRRSRLESELLKTALLLARRPPDSLAD